MPAATPDAEEFVRSSAPFLRYLADRAEARRPASLREIVASAGGPDNVAVLVEDVLNGFCKEGALASTRVGAIVPPIVDLLTRAHAAGVPHVALVCDTHSPQAEEFHQFAPHCVAGTDEAEPVDELKALPFYDTFYVVRKNSISPWYSQANLASWLHARQRAGVSAVLAVGDCTDLCLHQLALPLKLAANQEDRPLRVVVPVDCVQTYDLPVEVAAGLGALPHHGDLLHEIFLYHLALNGVEVVSRITD